MNLFESLIEDHCIINPLREDIYGSGVFVNIHYDKFKDVGSISHLLKFEINNTDSAMMSNTIDDLDLMMLSSKGYMTPNALIKPYILVSNKREKELIDAIKEAGFIVKTKEIYDILPEIMKHSYTDSHFCGRHEFIVTLKEFMILVDNTNVGKAEIFKSMIQYIDITDYMLTDLDFKRTLLKKMFENSHHIETSTFESIVEKLIN